MATIQGYKRSATKLGTIIQGPVSGMGDNIGPYFASVVKGSEITGWPSAQWPVLLYFSTDHDSTSNPVTGGNGGIFLYCWDGVDPTSWSNWDDIKENPEFSYMSPRPANPIYVDTVEGKQTETPRVKVIGGTVNLYYHNDDIPYVGDFNPTYTTQRTCLATGSDGVNFTRQGVVLTYDPQYEQGIGHTGYAQVEPNPYPQIPFNYITDSLFGGGGVNDTGGGARGLWVSDDGTTFTVYRNFSNNALGRMRGAVPDSGGFEYSYLPQIVTGKREGAYWRCLGTYQKFGVSGIDLKNAEIAEYLLDDDFNLVAGPELTIGLGGSGADDESQCAEPIQFSYNGVVYVIYGGRNAADDTNSLLVASVEEIPNTWNTLGVILGAKTEQYAEDFSDAGGSDPSVMTATNATFDQAFDVGRLLVPYGNTGRAFYSTGVNLSSFDIVDFRFTKLRANDSQVALPKTIGINNAITGGTLVDAVFVRPEPYSANSELNIKFRNSDSLVSNTTANKWWGYADSWRTDQKESQQADQDITIRVDTVNSVVYLLNGFTEVAQADITGLDFNQDFYPFIEMTNTDPANSNQEILQLVKLECHTYPNAKLPQPDTPALTATPQNSAIDVSTTPATGATGYKAFYGQNGVYQEQDLGASTSGTISGLTNGESYDVYMRSYNADGVESEPTSEQNVTPAASVSPVEVNASIANTATAAQAATVYFPVNVNASLPSATTQALSASVTINGQPVTVNASVSGSMTSALPASVTITPAPGEPIIIDAAAGSAYSAGYRANVTIGTVTIKIYPSTHYEIPNYY